MRDQVTESDVNGGRPPIRERGGAFDTAVVASIRALLLREGAKEPSSPTIGAFRLDNASVMIAGSRLPHGRIRIGDQQITSARLDERTTPPLDRAANRAGEPTPRWLRPQSSM